MGGPAGVLVIRVAVRAVACSVLSLEAQPELCSAGLDINISFFAAVGNSVTPLSSVYTYGNIFPPFKGVVGINLTLQSAF